MKTKYFDPKGHGYNHVLGYYDRLINNKQIIFSHYTIHKNVNINIEK
jgi:hypothetical protein